MLLKGPARGCAVFVAVVGLTAPAIGQNQMVIDRGLLDDLPYTVIYPDMLRVIDDGSPETIVTLEHPDAFLRCDVFAVQGGEDGWTAESALQHHNTDGIRDNITRSRRSGRCSTPHPSESRSWR